MTDAYTRGFEKELSRTKASASSPFAVKAASKIDRLLRAGKLHPQSWSRYINSVPAIPTEQFPRQITETLIDLPFTGGYSVSGEIPNHPLKMFRRRRTYSLANMPTFETAGLPRTTWGEITEPVSQRKILPWTNQKPKTLSTDLFKSNVPRSFSANAWGSQKTIGRPLYDRIFNVVADTAPFTGDRRHETGHWAATVMRNTNNTKFKIMMRSLLAKMRATNPKFMTLLDKGGRINGPTYPIRVLNEVGGHYMAARAGRGGANLRKLTQDNWISPWADKMRNRFPNQPGLASTVEHLQRNYLFPGGKLNVAPPPDWRVQNGGMDDTFIRDYQDKLMKVRPNFDYSKFGKV